MAPNLRPMTLASLSLLISMRVSAQSAGSYSGDLDEVVVTASKQGAQTVLHVPGAIQAISSEALQEQGVAGIVDIADKIPGLSIEDHGPGDRKYIIRGISSIGESTTGVFYDEAVISGSNAGNDGGGFESDVRLYDLDHIEVLRGPQGTLYGAGSMSGTIRFITNKPDLEKFAGYLTTEYSDTRHGSNNYNVNGAMNLPIVDEVLAARVVGWKVNDSGYINQIRLGSIGFEKGINNDIVDGGRISLRYKPIDALVLDAAVTTQTETSNGADSYTPAGVTAWSGSTPQLAPVQGCDLCNTDVTRSPWQDVMHIFSLTGTYTMANGVVTGTTNQFNRNINFAIDSTPILVEFGIPIEAGSYEPQTRRVNSSELRYASTFDFPVNFVVGAFREHDTSDLVVQVIKTNGFGEPAGPFSSANSDDALTNPDGNTLFGRTDHRVTTQNAGFGEVTWKITPKLAVLGGLRYYRETLDGVQVQTHPFGGFPADSLGATPIQDVGQTYSKVTTKFNVSYDFNEAALVYVTAAQGFRGGGLNAQSEPFETIPRSYSPDSLWSYELGSKGKLFGGLLDYQVDVYTILWSNIQVNETSPGGFNYIGNAGDARVKGVEYEFDAHPLNHLKVFLAGSFTDARLTHGATPEQYEANPTLGLTGDKVPEVPRFAANLGVDYTAPIGNEWEGTLAADLNFRGREDSYFSSNVMNIPLESYFLTNLRAGLSHGLWTTVVFARNVTDRRAQVSAINNSAIPESLITVRPRTVGINITRKF